MLTVFDAENCRLMFSGVNMFNQWKICKYFAPMYDLQLSGQKHVNDDFQHG